MFCLFQNYAQMEPDLLTNTDTVVLAILTLGSWLIRWTYFVVLLYVYYVFIE